MRCLGKVAGLGTIVIGCRSTTFSTPSSIDVLCTQPLPLWMSIGVDPGYAPHGGVPNAKVIPLQLLTATEPYCSRAIACSIAAAMRGSLKDAGCTISCAESVPHSRLFAKSTARSRNSIGSSLPTSVSDRIEQNGSGIERRLARIRGVEPCYQRPRKLPRRYHADLSQVRSCAGEPLPALLGAGIVRATDGSGAE